MKFIKTLTAALALSATILGAPQSATAQEYPDRLIKAVVPFSAGGGTDRWVRVLASSAIDYFGQAWHVQNRGGAGGTVGWKFMMDQPADGHTLLFGSYSTGIASYLEKTPPYDPKDVKIAAFYVVASPTLVTANGGAFSDWEGMVKFAQENPGRLTVGGTNQLLLGAASVLSQAGIEATYIPYAGSSKAQADMLGKHIHIAVISPASAGSLGDKITPIAFLGNSEAPAAVVANIGAAPTAADLGLEGFDAPRLIAVHPDTPDEIVAQISDRVEELLQDKSVAGLIKRLGEDVTFIGYKEAQARYEANMDSIAKMVKILK